MRHDRFHVAFSAAVSLVVLLFACSFLTSVGIPAAVAQPPSSEATTASDPLDWKRTQQAQLDEQLSAESDRQKRAELQARREWLQSWRPGQMDGLDAFASQRQSLRTEPGLSELRGNISESAKEQLDRAVALQQRAAQLDTPDVRKANLRETVAVSEKLVQTLRELQGQGEDVQADEQLKWALAFALYRQARALAYHELPDVIERQPIDDREAFDQRLRRVHTDLQSLFEKSQPEFVLLDVRMLRRDGKHGTALQLLERHRSTIAGKWYLKKRRDLLEELGWQPAWREAAAIYRQSGLADAAP